MAKRWQKLYENDLRNNNNNDWFRNFSIEQVFLVFPVFCALFLLLVREERATAKYFPHRRQLFAYCEKQEKHEKFLSRLSFQGGEWGRVGRTASTVMAKRAFCLSASPHTCLFHYLYLYFCHLQSLINASIMLLFEWKVVSSVQNGERGKSKEIDDFQSKLIHTLSSFSLLYSRSLSSSLSLVGGMKLNFPLSSFSL